MKKSGRNKGITLRDVVNHISSFKQEVGMRFDRMEKNFDIKLGNVIKDLAELRTDFRAHCKGVDDLDFRVQDIEDEKLPERVCVIEEKLKIAV